MADDSEFITKLIRFGLSEKEAQLYFHLLKYGPKTTSLLAKSLKTYREDVYRMVTSLIDKGMVNPSLASPTVYAAVEVDIALDAALKKHETELREMERRKLELMELSQQNRFRPSDEFSSYKVIRSLRELSVVVSLASSAEKEILSVGTQMGLIASSLYGFTEEIKKFRARGGKVRLIIDISYPLIELVQQELNKGVDVRHLDGYTGVIFIVFDRKIACSAINFDIKRASLDEPIAGLQIDDPSYANYLVSTFELLWKQSVPAAQRIEELLREGPPQI
ncbi:MAG TPA: helix-turn-helix domain-containing protein [Candidatus Acidoferrales bacterium]|nr:helix-turn-helix domain-containing protein [Candidatus Acidoferrales bacterium]